MSVRVLKLERFDPPEAAPLCADAGAGDIRLQRARAEAYAEGFEAGKTAASGGGVERLLGLIANQLDNLNAQSPGGGATEAGAALKTLLEALAPAICTRGFAAEAAAAFARAAGEGRAGGIEIAAPTEHADDIEKLIARAAPGAAVTVRADPALQGARALARWTGGGLEFDLERASADCLAALDKALQSLSSEDM